MIRRAFRRLLNGPEPEDIIANWDFVRCDRFRGVWWVRSINGNPPYATIACEGNHREIVPLITLHALDSRGDSFDRRAR